MGERLLLNPAPPASEVASRRNGKRRKIAAFEAQRLRR